MTDPPVFAATPVRNAVRALITRHNQVLMLRKRTADGHDRYALPGGGQRAGETLLETLLRECDEEIGTVVDVVGLVHVAEIAKPRNGRGDLCRQQVEFVFFPGALAHHIVFPGEDIPDGSRALFARLKGQFHLIADGNGIGQFFDFQPDLAHNPARQDLAGFQADLVPTSG